jgi:tetratricopeptide (TPR) repeat protein
VSYRLHLTLSGAWLPVQAQVLILGLMVFPSCSRQTPSGGSPISQVPPEQRQKSDMLVQKGLRFLADGLQDEAAGALEEARRLNPASTPAGLALVRAYRMESRFAAARKLLEEILASPDTAEADRTRARELLVEVLLESGDLESAGEACRPLLAAGSPSAATRRLAGMVAYRKGDLPGSISHLKEAIRLDPQDSQALSALGLAMLQSGNLQEAVVNLEEAVRLDPDSQAAVSNLAKVYQRLGREGEAQSALEKFRTLYDSKTTRQKVGPLRAKGMEAYDAGRLDEALEIFQEVLRLVPRDPQALAQAGSVLLAMQRLDEAQASLEQSLSILPESDFTLTELARVRALKNDLPAAIDLLQKAVRANPAAAQPHYFLAGIYLAQGRRQDFLKEKAAYLRLRAGSPGDALLPLPDGESP